MQNMRYSLNSNYTKFDRLKYLAIKLDSKIAALHGKFMDNYFWDSEDIFF